MHVKQYPGNLALGVPASPPENTGTRPDDARTVTDLLIKLDPHSPRSVDLFKTCLGAASRPAAAHRVRRARHQTICRRNPPRIPKRPAAVRRSASSP